jgi:flagellar motor component MotA
MNTRKSFKQSPHWSAMTGTIVREISAESLVNPFANELKRRKEMVNELLDFRKMLELPLAG